MEQNTIVRLNKLFEEYAYQQDGVEYWLARELQSLLGETVSDHFVDINKMILNIVKI